MSPRPSSVLPVLLVALALGGTGCGDDAEGDTAAVPTITGTTTVATVPEPDVKVQKLDVADAKEAAGTVSLCGALAETRRLVPAMRRFDGVSLRLQSSALGFPDGRGRPLRAFQDRQRTESRDCDVFVAETPADVPAVVADGGVYDLAKAVETWTAAPGAPPLQPVRAGDRVFAVPVRAVPSSGVMVVSVHGRNPAGALVLVRALADARTPEG